MTIPDYPKEQLWDIYKNLPQDLQEAMFSENSADIIYDICIAQGIKNEDEITQTAKLIGFVFLGILPPSNLEKELKDALAVSFQTSQKITEEITDQLFFALKDSLEALYQTKLKFKNPQKFRLAESKKQAQKPAPEPKTKIAQQKPAIKKDAYREPME